MGTTQSATVNNLPANGRARLRPALDAAPDRVVLHRLHVHGHQLRQGRPHQPHPGQHPPRHLGHLHLERGDGRPLVQPLGGDDRGRHQPLRAGDGDQPLGRGDDPAGDRRARSTSGSGRSSRPGGSSPTTRTRPSTTARPPSPAPRRAAPCPGTSATFTWSAGAGALSYSLWVGTHPGRHATCIAQAMGTAPRHR